MLSANRRRRGPSQPDEDVYCADGEHRLRLLMRARGIDPGGALTLPDQLLAGPGANATVALRFGLAPIGAILRCSRNGRRVDTGTVVIVA